MVKDEAEKFESSSLSAERTISDAPGIGRVILKFE